MTSARFPCTTTPFSPLRYTAAIAEENAPAQPLRPGARLCAAGGGMRVDAPLPAARQPLRLQRARGGGGAVPRPAQGRLWGGCAFAHRSHRGPQPAPPPRPSPPDWPPQVPPVPQRLNYVLWVEDIVGKGGDETVYGLDVGLGPSCIHPFLAVAQRCTGAPARPWAWLKAGRRPGWRMMGTDVAEAAVGAPRCDRGGLAAQWGRTAACDGAGECGP